MNNELKHFGVRGMKWGKHKFGKDDSAAKAFNTAYNNPFSPFTTNGYGQLGKVLNTSLIGLQGNRNDLNALRKWDAATKAAAGKQASVNNLPQNLLDFAKKRYNINSGSSSKTETNGKAANGTTAGSPVDAFLAMKIGDSATGTAGGVASLADKEKKKADKSNKTNKTKKSGQKKSSNSGRSSSGGGERIRSGGSGGSGGRSGGQKKSSNSGRSSSGGGERIRSGGSGGSGGRSGGKKKGGEKLSAQDVTGTINDPKKVQNEGKNTAAETNPETDQTQSQQETSDVVRGNAQTSVNSPEALALIKQYRAFVDQLLKAFMMMGYSRQQSDERAEQVAENVYTPGTADAKVKTKKRG